MAGQSQNIGSNAAAASGSNLGFEDELKAAAHKEIAARRPMPTPGRCVEVAEIEDDGVPFEEKMAELLVEPFGQMNEAEELDAPIRQNWEILGHGA